MAADPLRRRFRLVFDRAGNSPAFFQVLELDDLTPGRMEAWVEAKAAMLTAIADLEAKLDAARPDAEFVYPGTDLRIVYQLQAAANHTARKCHIPFLHGS